MLMDPKLSGYLRRVLSHEMSAVQQYLTQSTLCELWGFNDAAIKLRQESVEELEHAQRLTRQMLSMGLLPNGTQLPAISVTHTLKDMLLADWNLEAEAIQLYSEASHYCARIGNEQAYNLFSSILQEEQAHLASLEIWITEINTMKSPKMEM